MRIDRGFRWLLSAAVVNNAGDGFALADDSPRHVRVTPVGQRWAGLEHALDAG